MCVRPEAGPKPQDLTLSNEGRRGVIYHVGCLCVLVGVESRGNEEFSSFSSMSRALSRQDT
eukprot:6271746-Prymnesium_polylepis.1